MPLREIEIVKDITANVILTSVFIIVSPKEKFIGFNSFSISHV